MIKNILGRTGLRVTQLGFGAMELRDGPDSGRKVTDQMAETILNAVLDKGINFIDTAPDYGLSEERIGRYIGHRRKEYFLATKCGCDPEDKGGHGGHIWTRDQLLKNIESSLKRLQTDSVEILQLHNPAGDDVPMDELIETLQEIQSQGLTRFIGTSHTLPWLTDDIERGVFDTFQIPYSCLEPSHHDVINRTADTGAGIIIRGGIGRGGPEAEMIGSVPLDVWKQANLQDLCDDVKPTELILRYTITHPNCHTTIVGTCSEEHLNDNLAAMAKGPLPDELYEEVRGRVAGVLAE